MRNKRNWMLAGISAMALIWTTGCETTTPKDERSEGRLLDDEHISESVKKELETEPTYKFTNVSVDTFAGIVSLSGFVNSDEQKRRAQEIAESTRGVRAVANGITLKPMALTPTSRPPAQPQQVPAEQPR